MVSVLFLPANCTLHSISHLDLLWHIDFLHWETRLAHRLQRYNLRTGLFLFFSGLLRKYVPLIAISLLVTFLYGGLVWNMFPQFAKASTSWEGHLSGAIAGTLCAIIFMKRGPQRPDPFDDEEEDSDTENEEESGEENTDPSDESLTQDSIVHPTAST